MADYFFVGTFRYNENMTYINTYIQNHKLDATAECISTTAYALYVADHNCDIAKVRADINMLKGGEAV